MTPADITALCTGIGGVITAVTALLALFVHKQRPHAQRETRAASRFCYAPHHDRRDHGLPNTGYEPHVHVPATDGRNRPVKVIWEDRP